MFSPYSFECVGYKQRRGKLWNCAKNFNKQKNVSVLDLIFQILVYYYYKLSYTGI